MNSLNHFFASLLIIHIIFLEQSLLVKAVFSLVFGTLIDLDHFIGKAMGKPDELTRTWIEEPFGILLLGLPIGLALATIDDAYLWMTLLPYSVHVLLDYITYHKVAPLAPFSNRTFTTGIFLSMPKSGWYDGSEKGPSEGYFTMLLLVASIFVV
jgi:hypothetical protein